MGVRSSRKILNSTVIFTPEAESLNNLNQSKLQIRNYAIKILAIIAKSYENINGIENIENSKDNKNDDKYYDLRGNVTYPNAPGIYIKNHKKVLIK